VLVVDSSVWIQLFREDTASAQSLELEGLLWGGVVRLVVPDLVLYEVLRGFRHPGEQRRARTLMESLDIESTGGHDLALQAAGHYRHLRVRGITVRNSIDVLIAAFCIERDYQLLHNDRDYDAFVTHRGLRVWQHGIPEPSRP
jgi:predicted nucleic acid-binding protein